MREKMSEKEKVSIYEKNFMDEWTVDVISHILSFIKQPKTKAEQQETESEKMELLKGKKTNVDFFEEKQQELEYYGSESDSVENEISLAVHSLEQINAGIDESLRAIAEKKVSLNATEKKLVDMKAKNVGTIKKYSTLFGTTEEGDKNDA